MKERLPEFRAAHGLADPTAPQWRLRVGPWTVTLPNFAWRQAAIDAHDMHHLITGYPLTLPGEIQLAAWEWGAGRYPDWRATAFCTPLIVAGAFAMPRRTWAAFRAGTRTRSLYPRGRGRTHESRAGKDGRD